MSRLSRLQTVVVAGLAVAGVLCIASDVAPWAIFDAMSYRPAINVMTAEPGLAVLLGVAAWIAAGLLVTVSGTWLLAIASSAAALAGMIVGIIESRIRVGDYLEQAAIVRLPNSTIHTKTVGTLAAVAAAALLFVCTCLLAIDWIRVRQRWVPIKRAGALALTAVSVTAGALLLSRGLDPHSPPMWSLGTPSLAP